MESIMLWHTSFNAKRDHCVIVFEWKYVAMANAWIHFSAACLQMTTALMHMEMLSSYWYFLREATSDQ